MALVGVIGIRVLNHFPGNTLSSLIGQSGNSASASWAVFLLHFLQRQQEDRGNGVGEFSQPSCFLQRVQENLEGSGFPWGLSKSWLLYSGLGFLLQHHKPLVIIARNVVQLNIPHTLSLVASVSSGFNELDLFLSCVVGRWVKEVDKTNLFPNPR